MDDRFREGPPFDPRDRPPPADPRGGPPMPPMDRGDPRVRDEMRPPPRDDPRGPPPRGIFSFLDTLKDRSNHLFYPAKCTLFRYFSEDKVLSEIEILSCKAKFSQYTKVAR